MRKYLLQIVPPAGETKTYDKTCERHSLVNTDDRTFIVFYTGAEKVLEVMVGRGHSFALQYTEVQHENVG
jgi:hypothetical protein